MQPQWRMALDSPRKLCDEEGVKMEGIPELTTYLCWGGTQSAFSLISTSMSQMQSDLEMLQPAPGSHMTSTLHVVWPVLDPFLKVSQLDTGWHLLCLMSLFNTTVTGQGEGGFHSYLLLKIFSLVSCSGRFVLILQV